MLRISRHLQILRDVWTWNMIESFREAKVVRHNSRPFRWSGVTPQVENAEYERESANSIRIITQQSLSGAL